MKRTSAKNVLAPFFQVEETASGYIASCPDCGVRFAVNVKRDVVADEYLRLLLEHATGEQVTFASDEEIREWLCSGEAKAKSFLSTLETAVARGPVRIQSAASRTFRFEGEVFDEGIFRSLLESH